MELAFIVWAVGTLPAVSSWLCLLLFIVIVCTTTTVVAIGFIFEIDPDESEQAKLVAAKFKDAGKTVLFLSLPFYFFFLLMPDKETAYQMLAAYGVQTVAENERVQELAGDGLDVLQALMKKAKENLEEQ